MTRWPTLLRVLAASCLVTPHFGFAVSPQGASTSQSEFSDSSLSSIVLTDQERARSRLWDLSAEEWQRYRLLMAGIRGSISPATLSPIEVLGIHARDTGERRRYAERWARLMREDAERILAFQRAYDEAGRRLYPSEQLIDLMRVPDRAMTADRLRPTDRVLLFVSADCTACDALVARALSRIERLAGIDLFLSGIASGDDAAVRAWAADRGIRPEWVTSRRVTLNHNQGALKYVAADDEPLPMILRRRGDEMTRLSRADL